MVKTALQELIYYVIYSFIKSGCIICFAVELDALKSSSPLFCFYPPCHNNLYVALILLRLVFYSIYSSLYLFAYHNGFENKPHFHYGCLFLLLSYP